MRTLLILPNTIVEDVRSTVKTLNINKVIVVLDTYYLNENQHMQKLALMHASIDFFCNQDINVPIELVYEHKLKPKETPYIYEPLDNEMFKKYKYCSMVKNPTILLTREEVSEMPMFTKQIDFYKYMRSKFDVLMKGMKPIGGRWSFDIFNRNKFPNSYEEPHIYTRASKRLLEEVKLAYPKAYGNSKNLHYPTSFKAAKQYLKKFIETKLDDFGKYQDAFDPEVKVGEHSNISAIMNIGLLTPEYVIRKIIESDKNIESVEGFVRQILGWREYMRYVYLRMPNIKKNIYLKQINEIKLPKQWYTASTGIPIFDTTISKILETGYAHHIERLMVLNNAMTMYGFSHKDIYNWFMRMFVDSYDWVMTGCAYMNHNAMAREDKYMTRIYISSGNYIKKMSHYRGVDIEVFDALFRSFCKKHAELISKDYMLAAYVKKYNMR